MHEAFADENLSRRIIPAVVELYPGSSQVALLGLEGHNDRELWEYVREHNFSVVTKDSDFHELSVLYGFPPKIIWLKCGNQPKQVIIKYLTEHYEIIEQFALNDQTGCLEIY